MSGAARVLGAWFGFPAPLNGLAGLLLLTAVLLGSGAAMRMRRKRLAAAQRQRRAAVALAEVRARQERRRRAHAPAREASAPSTARAAPRRTRFGLDPWVRHGGLMAPILFGSILIAWLQVACALAAPVSIALGVVGGALAVTLNDDRGRRARLREAAELERLLREETADEARP